MNRAQEGEKGRRGEGATPESRVENRESSRNPDSPRQAGVDAEAAIRRMSRRSFLWATAATAAALGGFEWLSSRPQADGVPWPLRRTLRANEKLWRGLYSPGRLAPTFDRSQVTPDPRVNGDVGLTDDFDPADWKLRLEGFAAGPAPLTLDQIRALPKTEMVTELHCVEGWTQIVHWAGARFSDFLRAYPPATISGRKADLERLEDLPEYVSMVTPDGGYYVGVEMAAALHPQTLLSYEMNGEPLTPEHGAPLRLVIPLKYGVKSIKRIGTIRLASRRPADYWAEQGYDWYIGL